MIARLQGIFFLAICALLCTGAATAHEVRPAYLQIDQKAPHSYTIVWKQPAMGTAALHLVPHLSNGWLEKPPADQFATIAYVIKTWKIRDTAADPIEGQTVSIEGLANTMTDAFVSIRLLHGRELNALVHPEHPDLVLHVAHHDGLPVPVYLQLGVEHILTGADHLMFVLGLLLLVGIRWQLLKAITAFTVAHSITLALAALGFVHLPPAVIEALVALSIVFVASELAHGEATLTHRHPWVIAFTFDLLHGLAFAGALADVGLPAGAIPLSLFLFNVGVEIGQLMFVGAAILTILGLRWLRPRLPAVAAQYGPQVPAYVIGSFAAFWFIGRMAAAFA